MTDVTGENSGNCKNGRGGGISKNGKLQPKLRFKGFTDAWEQQQIEKIFNYERPDKYICFDKDIERSGAVPVLTANKAFILGYTNDSSNVYHRASIIFDDFTMDSKFVDFSYKVRSSALKILTVKADHDLYFAYTLLSNQHFPDMGHARHYISYVQKISVLLPNAEAQLTVSHLFRCLDSLIAAAERKVCLLKKKKHAYLNHIFTQHLRFTGHTTPWHQQAFKELVSRQSKTNGFSLLPTVEYEDIIPGEGRLNKNIYKKKKGKHGVLFQQGDILFGKLRPYLKNWVFAEFDGIAVGDFWVLRRLTGMNNRFLFFLIQSPSFEAVSSLSTGTKMPRADWNLVSNTLFSIPTEQAEQTEIARFFQTLDSLIAAAERKVSLLKKRKQAYLQKMFV